MTTPSEEYINYICSLYNDHYDDRVEDSKPSGEDWMPGMIADHKSLAAFQRQLEDSNIMLSTSKIKKILITGGCWTTERSREIQELYLHYTSSIGDGGEGLASDEAIKQIADDLDVSVVTVSTNLPYSDVVYNLEDKSQNARRCQRYKQRQKEREDTSVWLWKKIIEMEGVQFTTSGRGSRPGVQFTYTISRTPSTGGGRRYTGESIDGYGNELWIMNADGSRKDKSISRSTVELAYSKAIEMNGKVSGPKKLGIPGGGSYLYPIFVKLGIIENGEA